MLEYGPRTICDGVPSCRGFGFAGQSHSNFLASTARVLANIFMYVNSKGAKWMGDITVVSYVLW